MIRYGRLVDDANGGLRIWKRPEKGRQYVIGSDTAQGVRGGDYSAAEVLDAETMEQCAEWHCHKRPLQWGYACARLGYYYNEAPIGFETHPSPYGLEALRGAQAYGYPRIWVHRTYDQLEQRHVTHLGWRRAANSTALLLGRVRRAINEGCPIHSEDLLDEMAAFKLASDQIQQGLVDAGRITEKIKRGDHDDRVFAYGIALLIRDDAWEKGEVTSQEPPIEDQADLFWRRRRQMDREDGVSAPQAPQYEELYDGR